MRPRLMQWLILTSRFRINEFSVEDLLALFLPYHETPHFAKMLTILHIKCVQEHFPMQFFTE